MGRRLGTKELVTNALVAAILCIMAPISVNIAISPVPLTLGLYAVLLAGIILGSRNGALCVLVYIFLGAVGLPVFSNYTGGIQKIAGPSGGYLIGYLFLAWMTGYFVEKFPGKIFMYFIGAVSGTIACYLVGTIWMGMQMGMTVMEALWAGVIPFLPLDIIKIVLAVLSCSPVRKTLIRQNLLSVS